MDRGRRCGLTLIELVLVVTIITILAAIVVPRFGNSIARYRLDAAAERVVADLALARRQARNTSTSIEVIFVPGLDQYVLKKIRDLDRSSAEYTVILSAEPYNATLTSADFGGDATVIFDGYGMPDSEGQVVLGARGESRVVYLDPDTGKASVQ